MRPTISVIIPVYNSEEFLSDCLKNVQKQTYSDFEVILIDDGSADRSREIMKRFAESDPRIKWDGQPNSGPSAARNAGLEMAAGDYIYFLDSDDVLKSDAFEKCLHAMDETQADMIMFDAETIIEDSYMAERGDTQKFSQWMSEFYDRSDCFSPYGVMDPLSFLRESIMMGKFRGNCWLYLGRSEFVQQVRFVESIRYYEDVLFLYELLQRVERIVYLPERFYRRRVRNGSLMTADNHLKIIEDNVACMKYIINSGERRDFQVIYDDIFLNLHMKFILERLSKVERSLQGIVPDHLNTLLETHKRYRMKMAEHAEQYQNSLNQLANLLKEDG